MGARPRRTGIPGAAPEVRAGQIREDIPPLIADLSERDVEMLGLAVLVAVFLRFDQGERDRAIAYLTERFGRAG